MLEDVQGMLGTAMLPILAAGTVWFLSKPCQGAVSSLPDPHVPPSLPPDPGRGSWGQHWGFAEEQVQVIHPSANPTWCLAGQAAMP